MRQSFHNTLDKAFARLAASRKLFASGWGEWDVAEQILLAPLFPQTHFQIAPQFKTTRRKSSIEFIDGTFTLPSTLLPEGAHDAHFRWVKKPGNKRICLIFAGAREEGYAVRTWLYGALVHEGIDLVFLEYPFYGLRRPSGYPGSALATVLDQLLLNISVVKEAQALLSWMRPQYDALGVAGFSMGGYMAALFASQARQPVAAAILAGGASPVPVFTEYLLSTAIDFSSLAKDMNASPAEARIRLASVLESACLTRFPAPKHPESCLIVGCRFDRFVPPQEAERLHQYWVGSELEWIQAGHVGGVFFNAKKLRSSVFRSFELLGEIL